MVETKKVEQLIRAIHIARGIFWPSDKYSTKRFIEIFTNEHGGKLSVDGNGYLINEDLAKLLEELKQDGWLVASKTSECELFYEVNQSMFKIV